MATKMPSVNKTKKSASRNLGPGVAGGVGVMLGSSVLGPALGPMVGGAVAGATQSSQDTADVITITGMMQGFSNLAGGGGGASGGSRGRM